MSAHPPVTTGEGTSYSTVPRLVASPFLGQYLLVQPGHAAGVRIPEVRYEELRIAAANDRKAPAWLVDAAARAWGTELPPTGLRETLLVRERSPYGYAKASWEINLGCDYDCEFCYLGQKRFAGLDWNGKQQLLRVMRDAGVLWLQITGGEALIDREFGVAYGYAHQLGMMVQVSSNGSSLRKRPIRELFARLRPYRLTVSLYGATAGTYDAVTRNRGAFGRFVEGLDAAREDRLPIRLNVIVSDDNAHEVDAMAGWPRSTASRTRCTRACRPRSTAKRTRWRPRRTTTCGPGASSPAATPATPSSTSTRTASRRSARSAATRA